MTISTPIKIANPKKATNPTREHIIHSITTSRHCRLHFAAKVKKLLSFVYETYIPLPLCNSANNDNRTIKARYLVHIWALPCFEVKEKSRSTTSFVLPHPVAKATRISHKLMILRAIPPLQ